MPLVSQSLSLAPDARKTVVLPFSGSVVGVGRAEIDVQDDLAADNQAFAAVETCDGRPGPHSAG